MKKTGIVRTLAFSTALFMLVSTGTAGASVATVESGEVPAPTRAGVSMSGLGGLDDIQVDVGSEAPDGPDVQPSSWACIRASRLETHTETREAGDVEVTIRRREQGCSSDAFTHYDFDTVAWDATAKGEIPTMVSVMRWERRADGASELVHSEWWDSTAVVDLTWSGEGPVDVSPTAGLYCFGIPWCLGAGLEIRRAASVAGSVRLVGLDATATLPDGQTGWMQVGRTYRVMDLPPAMCMCA